MRSTFQVLGNLLGWLHKSRRTYQCRHHNGSLYRHMIHWHILMDLPRSHLAQFDCPAGISPGAREKRTKSFEVYHVMLFTVVIWYTPEKLTAGTWKFQEQQQQQQQQQQRQREKHLNQTSIFSGSPAVSFTAYDTMVGFFVSSWPSSCLPHCQFATQSTRRIGTGRRNVVDTIIGSVGNWSNHMFT